MAGGLAQATRGFLSSGGGDVFPTPALAISTNTIDILWASNVNLSVIGQNVSNWVINVVVGSPVTVLTVTQINPTTTRLTTSDQTIGGTYTLEIPAGAVTDATTNAPNPSFSLPFVGDGTSPSFSSATAPSSTAVLCTFSEPLVISEGTNPLNYSIDNGLNVLSVVQNSATQFILTTDEMIPVTIYTVTVSGVHDLVGNPII